MPNLIQPAAFTSQPQYAAPIDWDNELSNGLAFAINSANPLVSAVDNHAFAGVIGSGISRGTGTAGRGILAASYTSALYWTGLTIGPVYTVAAYILDSDQSGNSIPFACFDGATNVFFLRSQFGLMDFRAYNTVGGNANPADAVNANPINKPILIAGVLDAGQAATLYTNGISRASATLTGTPNTVTTARKLGVTDETGGLGFGFNGRLYAAFAWNRALSASEIASLSVNPWQLFRAPVRRFWPADAGGATFFYNPMTGRGGTVAQPLVVH